MVTFEQIVSISGSLVATVLIPLVTAFMFYDSRKRKAEAEARQAETDNITSYAAEWKKNYEEEKEAKTAQETKLNAKIDQLYAEKEADRKRIRELMQRNQELELKSQSLEFRKCEKRGCKDRIPPSDF